MRSPKTFLALQVRWLQYEKAMNVKQTNDRGNHRNSNPYKRQVIIVERKSPPRVSRRHSSSLLSKRVQHRRKASEKRVCYMLTPGEEQECQQVTSLPKSSPDNLFSMTSHLWTELHSSPSAGTKDRTLKCRQITRRIKSVRTEHKYFLDCCTKIQRS